MQIPWRSDASDELHKAASSGRAWRFWGFSAKSKCVIGGRASRGVDVVELGFFGVDLVVSRLSSSAIAHADKEGEEREKPDSGYSSDDYPSDSSRAEVLRVAGGGR